MGSVFLIKSLCFIFVPDPPHCPLVTETTEGPVHFKTLLCSKSPKTSNHQKNNQALHALCKPNLKTSPQVTLPLGSPNSKHCLYAVPETSLPQGFCACSLPCAYYVLHSFLGSLSSRHPVFTLFLRLTELIPARGTLHLLFTLCLPCSSPDSQVTCSLTVVIFLFVVTSFQSPFLTNFLHFLSFTLFYFS